ncbi:MAG: AAA family ATPase [Nanoarchaeota archaeon]|nr:AAA family ATPase [Nanoarchaeota archaeon]
MVKKVIVITGTPGVGKSTLAKIVASRLKLERLDLSQYYNKISTRYNRKKHCYDVDRTKFIALVKSKLKESEKGLIIDSHIAHLLPKRMVDLCIVLICSNLTLLQRRLNKRGYSQKKIRENLDAEIFQVCLLEAKEKGHKVVVVDGCTFSSKKMITQIWPALKNLGKKRTLS